MVAAPSEHRPDHRHEVGASPGEHLLVAEALARLLVGPPLQQPEIDQLGQPRRDSRFGDARIHTTTVTMLVNVLEQRGRHYGLQTMCEDGDGQRHHYRAALATGTSAEMAARVVI